MKGVFITQPVSSSTGFGLLTARPVCCRRHVQTKAARRDKWDSSGAWECVAPAHHPQPYCLGQTPRRTTTVVVGTLTREVARSRKWGMASSVSRASQTLHFPFPPENVYSNPGIQLKHLPIIKHKETFLKGSLWCMCYHLLKTSKCAY